MTRLRAGGPIRPRLLVRNLGLNNRGELKWRRATTTTLQLSVNALAPPSSRGRSSWIERTAPAFLRAALLLLVVYALQALRHRGDVYRRGSVPADQSQARPL